MMKLRGFAVLLVAVAVLQLGVQPSSAQLFGRKNNDESALRINQLEEQVRQLTGQIEQLSHQLQQTQDFLNRMQQDNEFRFQQLEGGTGKRSDAGSTSQQPAGSQNLAASVPGAAAPVTTDGAMDWGGGEAPGNEAPAGGAGPIDLSALANGNAGAFQGESMDFSQGPSGVQSDFAGLSITGDPRTDYDNAYSQAIAGDYVGAEDGFRAFLETYPDHELAANANYWLGESLLAQQDFRGAADSFLKTYTDFPGSAKRADSLLKLGISLRGLGENDAACATFSELISKFPSAAPAVLSQARDERSRASCA